MGVGGGGVSRGVPLMLMLEREGPPELSEFCEIHLVRALVTASGKTGD